MIYKLTITVNTTLQYDGTVFCIHVLHLMTANHSSVWVHYDQPKTVCFWKRYRSGYYFNVLSETAHETVAILVQDTECVQVYQRQHQGGNNEDDKQNDGNGRGVVVDVATEDANVDEHADK